MDRRRFLQQAALLAGGCSLVGTAAAAGEEVSASHLPRWRGFNLLEKYVGERNRPFNEADFALLAGWKFDFVRLPLSYRCWTDAKDWRQLREPVLKEIDQAVEFGRQHGIHVNLNFHRAPGYCVNPPAEPKDLWRDEEALETCAFHWGRFAERYKGIPNNRLSFDLLNEPARVSEPVYVRVVRRLVQAIRERDPDRLVIADGLQWGTVPVQGLVDLKVAQSTRGYAPMQISHYKASWVQGSDRWPEPAWPFQDKGGRRDKDRLRRETIEPWQALARKGVGIHVGEWGAHHFTPHAVVLAWMRDRLDLWREAGWGWALWNLRGSFGILDSGRRDVAYEEFQGHKLDRQMLELLRRDEQGKDTAPNGPG
jgi:endoglucanase